MKNIENKKIELYILISYYLLINYKIINWYFFY